MAEELLTQPSALQGIEYQGSDFAARLHFVGGDAMRFELRGHVQG